MDKFDPLYKVVDVINNVKAPKGSQLELECRFTVDERKSQKARARQLSASQSTKLAKLLIGDLSKTHTTVIEQSINFIKDNSQIKQLVFVNGQQQKSKQKHYKKEQIINQFIVVTNPSYKLAFAFEHTIDEFPVRDAQHARIKLRISIDLKVWRLDITLVKLVPNMSNPQMLKDYKEKMLYKLSVDEFCDKAPWDFCDYIEFETEYIGDFAKFEPKDLNTASNLLRDYIDKLALSNLDFADDYSDDSIQRDNQQRYQAKLYELAKLIKPRYAEKFKNKFGIKQLSNQVIELDKNTFLAEVLEHIDNYYITDKVDGKRAILLLNEDGAWAVSNELSETYTTKNITSVYVFDTEFYEGAYFIFDVMVWEGKSLVEEPFESRMEYFTQAKKLINAVDGLECREKPFIKLTKNFAQEIKKLKKRTKLAYETDGFVLTPADGQYITMQVYKYKPVDKMSIDFLIKKCPQNLLGMTPYIASKNKTLYILFCGIAKGVYFKLNMELINHYNDVFPDIDKKRLPDYLPIQFEPSDYKYAYLYLSERDNLDGEIGEFTRSADQWKLLRTRDDRQVELARGNYFGNNYKVAEITWLNFSNPLVIEDLKRDAYFAIHDNPKYKASRSFNSFVKAQIFEQFKKTPYVIDMASGKGQDLFRYARYDMQEVLFCDIDATALQELIARKHSFSRDRNIRNSMRVYMQHLDLNNKYKDNVKKLDDSGIYIPNGGVDLIICNFAFHYLIRDRSAILNVINFVNHYLKPGGRFVFTAFDGQAVINLMGKDTEWKSSDGLFHIKKHGSYTILKPFGQQIDVKLPFSDEEYYTENLISIDYIEREFERKKMSLEIDKAFGEYLTDYKRTNSNGFNLLTEEDKTFTNLYHYYCFYKEKQ